MLVSSVLKPLRVGLIGYDGVQALDLIGPSDAFSITSITEDNDRTRPGYEVVVLGLSGKSFRAESGVLFQPQCLLRNAPPLDTLIIPGGVGARMGKAGPAIADWISSHYQHIRRIAFYRRRHYLHPPYRGQRSKPLPKYAG